MHKDSLFSTSSPTLVFVDLLMIAILTDVRWYCAFNLHFSDDYWHWAFFHMPISYLFLFRTFDDFLIGLFVFLVLNFISSLKLWILTPYQLYHWQIWSPIQWVVFPFCWWFPLLCKNFLGWCSPICLFFLLFPLSKEICQKKHCCEKCLRVDYLFSSSIFMVSV